DFESHPSRVRFPPPQLSKEPVGMCYRTRTRRHCTPTLHFASLVGMVDTAVLNTADLRVVPVRIRGEASPVARCLEHRPFGGGGRRFDSFRAKHGDYRLVVNLPVVIRTSRVRIPLAALRL